jgi:hypothetical protein
MSPLSKPLYDLLHNKTSEAKEGHGGFVSRKGASSASSSSAVTKLKLPCVFLDTQGNAVHLPFDHTESFARWIVRNDVTQLKCYKFDRVYRQEGKYETRQDKTR